ncbi:MAG: hypothetical protein R3D05_22845 [Dongiaceae bacterium]
MKFPVSPDAAELGRAAGAGDGIHLRGKLPVIDAAGAIVLEREGRQSITGGVERASAHSPEMPPAPDSWMKALLAETPRLLLAKAIGTADLPVRGPASPLSQWLRRWQGS